MTYVIAVFALRIVTIETPYTESQTKHRWIAFYNEELENPLHDYIN